MFKDFPKNSLILQNHKLFNASIPPPNMTNEENSKNIQVDWVKMKPAEVEKIIINLNKEGKTPSQIGMALRDEYGIPRAKLVGGRISRVLKANNQTPITEKVILEKKMQNLESHIGKMEHDLCAKRSLAKKQWTIAKLRKRN